MLDQLDRELIKELQNEGRKSYRDIGRMMGVSEGTIRKRVKRLQEQGVMKIRAVLNPRKFGYNVESIIAFQVRMADLDDVVDLLIKKPNIRYLAYVAGRYDMIASIITRTTEELGQFMKDHIYSSTSILRAETFINLEIVKNPWIEIWDVDRLIGNSELSNHKKR